MSRALLFVLHSGGQAEALALARGAVDQDYVVALSSCTGRLCFCLYAAFGSFGGRRCGRGLKHRRPGNAQHF